MIRQHNPEVDGYRAKWAVGELDTLTLGQYKGLLRQLGELGLSVSVAEIEDVRGDFSVTQETLLEFARGRGMREDLAKRAWTSLTSNDPQQASVRKAAGIRHIVDENDTIGVSWQSLNQASEMGALSTIRGFRIPESGSLHLVTEYLAASASETTASK